MQQDQFNPLKNLFNINQNEQNKNLSKINSFICKIPEKGFVLANNVTYLDDLNNILPNTVLVEKENIKKKYKEKNLNQKERYLFWEFANLTYSDNKRKKNNKKLILDFANKYGSLVNGNHMAYTKEYRFSPQKIDPKSLSDFQYNKRLELGEYAYIPVPTESIAFWEVKISEMKAITLLWEAIVKEETKILNKIINWKEKSVDFILSPSFEELERDDGCNNSFTGIIAGKDNEGDKISWEKFKTFKKNDLFEPAKFLLEQQFNFIFKYYLFGDKIKTFDLNESKKNSIKFDTTDETKSELIFFNGETKIIPHNLLSYMWLEFYNLTTDDKDIGWCKLCGGPEDITDKRSDWETHTICNKYRYQKKYRDLKAFEEGKKTKEDIVESWENNRWNIEVTLEDVEKWIKEK
jgi:hypothetical protein